MVFKRKAKNRPARTSYFGKKSKSRRSNSGGSSVKLIQLDAMIYGAVREKTSNLIAPLVAKIPLGNIADEVAMGGINYLVAKNTSGMIKDVALKGLVIENARLGEALVSGGLGGLLGNSTKTTSDGYVYG